ncbi:MAG TPA: alkaline phosphatase family protein [Verrucomicrobiae bacterium]|nr:alkaline phosphatase family protein [Verrucomicrobiae bacterium]
MPPSGELSLFVFIDAFGWEIARKYPFLDDVLITKRPLGTIFGYSSTCDPTILTGKLPREHGHFSFFYHNPADSPFGICRLLRFLPRSITRRGRVRRVMSRIIRRYYGYTGYFQIYNMPFRYLSLFDYSEKRDIYQKDGINGGCPTIFDYLRDHQIPFYLSDWRAGEERNLASLEAALNAGRIRFAYLYMAAMDATLHQYGTDSEPVAAKIRWYEQQLRRILQSAHEKFADVRVFVFSDHGMTDTIQDVPLMSRIDALGFRFGVDFNAVYDSTMARFWFFNDEARRRIVETLQRERHGRILTRAELAGYGCDFPDSKYGELFFLLDPGYLLCPSFMGETSLAGMHGFAPEHKDSVALFASNVVPDPMPERLDDLYGLMLREVSAPAGAAK